MELRQIVAYALIALVVAVATLALLRVRHNSHHRRVMRNRRREQETYHRQMAEHEADGG